MSWYIVDCESDGPIPNKYSLICFGAIKLTEKLDNTFYGNTKPISEHWSSEALAVSGFLREQHLTFDDPKKVFENFNDWIWKTNLSGRPTFISDNNSYDWQFINYYFHYYLGQNPFGFSSRRIGDIYSGYTRNVFGKWKHLRKTRHTHDPVDDAKGNAEVLLLMKNKFGINIPTI